MVEYIKNCKYCKMIFKTSVKYQNYCSPECRTKYHNDKKQAERPVYEKVCPYCGTLFTTTDNRKKFCNKKCKHKYEKNKEKAERRAAMEAVRKICPTCGREFNPNVHNQEFCSKTCLRKAVWSEHKEKIKSQYEKVCPTCGKNFIAKRKNTKYCSTECAHKGWAFNNSSHLKEYKKQYREKNSEHIAEHLKKYCEEHKDELRIKKNEYFRRRIKQDPVFRMKGVCREMVNRCLKYRKLKRTKEILGYSSNDLKEHLESLFYRDMNWEEKDKWEVHHIVPLDSFDFLNEDGTDNYDTVKEANALGNLMPLFKEDHKKLNILYRSKKIYLTKEEIQSSIINKEDTINEE